MPSRWAPSRSVVSKTWKASPSGVPAGSVRDIRGAPGCRGRDRGNKKDPPRVREVCASAVVRLADALVNNDHAEVRHAVSVARIVPRCHTGPPHGGITAAPPRAAGRTRRAGTEG